MSGAQVAAAMKENRRSENRGSSGRAAEALPPLSTKPLPGTALCMVLVALAIALGGGGTVNPPTEMILQVLTALVLLPLVISTDWQRGLGPVQKPAWLLGALVLLMPILHLIPLPPSIWQKLPGRAVELQSLALVGADQTWMPLSMAPARTFASLLAMICPVLLLLQVSRLSLRGRSWLCAVIVAGAAVSLALGVLQLSRTGGLEWSLYGQFSQGFLVGFQANRNAEADFLLIAVLAMGVLVTSRLKDGRNHAVTWSGLLLSVLALAVGLFMTGSRTGIGLFILTLMFLAAMLWPMLHKRRAALRWLGGTAAVLAIGVAILSQLQSGQKVLARFSLTKEPRWDLWADTWYASGQVWPFGSGIGTIVPMLEAAERLDVVDPTRPVRAHNDWLEWTLETGLPGQVVLGMIIVAIAWVAIRALSTANRSDSGPGRRAQVIFACGVLAIEALHAIVDYPMRSMSLAMLTAVAVAFLLEPAAPQRNQP